MKPRILSVGEVGIRLYARTDSLPLAGRASTGRNYEILPSGRGALAAVVFSRLGGEALLCARAGADTYGPRIKQILREDGVDTRFLTLDNYRKTSLSLVIDESGKGTREIYYPEANSSLTPDDIEDALTAEPDAVYLHFGLERRIITETAASAAFHGIPVIIDGGPADEDFPLSALEGIEIFSVDEDEAFAYTGIRPGTMQESLRACIALENKTGAKNILIKLGKRGVFAYDGKYYKIIAPYDVEATDSTGAGDIFSSAMALEYISSGGDIKKACEFASLTVAYSLSLPGDIQSVPTYDKLRRFALENGIDYEF